MDDNRKAELPKKGFNWYITDWYDVAAIPVTIAIVLFLKSVIGW